MDLRSKLSEHYESVRRASGQLQALAAKSLEQLDNPDDGLRSVLSAELGSLRDHLYEYFTTQEELVRAKLTAQPQVLVERVLAFFREHENLLQDIRRLEERADEVDLPTLSTRVMETLCRMTEHEIGERILIHEFEAA